MTDQELLRKLASAERDPVSDTAEEIVRTLEREVCGRGTAWHDIELSEIAEEIIRKNLKFPIDTSQHP